MKKLWVYLLVSFGLGWLLQALGMLLGGVWFTVCTALCMFAPLLGVLLANGGLKREKSGVRWKLGLKGRRLGWWFAAWFAPLGVAIVGAALFFLLLPGRFDTGLGQLNAQLAAMGDALPVGPLLLALISVVQMLTYAPFLNMVFAVGEEGGWRGFMTPLLCEKLGRRAGLLLSGVIWGVWHWPIILLAGYNYGYGYFGAPVTGGLMMCVACVALGVLLSFLYERTESIWAPALAHGAFNAAAGLGVLFLPIGTTSMILGPAPLGLVAGLPMFALAAWAFFAPRGAKARPAADALPYEP